MKMWCNNCGQAVTPDYESDSDFHSEVDTRQFEDYDIPKCPFCGEELEYEAKECGCGEYRSEEDYACPSCMEIIDEAVKKCVEELMHFGWNAQEACDAINDGVWRTSYRMEKEAEREHLRENECHHDGD